MVISKVRGAFTRWHGEVEFDPTSLQAGQVRVHIDAASIDTNEPKRDAHLRSPDFFDVEKFPELTFVSKRVESGSDGRYRVLGELTIHGVTREVELDTKYLGSGKDPWGNERVGFEARASISRKDFGLTWNQALETGGLLVGDEIEIALDLQAVKTQAAQAA